jgi:hypothetical protein
MDRDGLRNLIRVGDKCCMEARAKQFFDDNLVANLGSFLGRPFSLRQIYSVTTGICKYAIKDDTVREPRPDLQLFCGPGMVYVEFDAKSSEYRLSKARMAALAFCTYRITGKPVIFIRTYSGFASPFDPNGGVHDRQAALITELWTAKAWLASKQGKAALRCQYLGFPDNVAPEAFEYDELSEKFLEEKFGVIL